MKTTHDIKDHSLPHAWADLQTEAKSSDWLQPEANRLAFADPEFLLRRETRGIRFQLEMLKPDLAQAEAGIEHTVVVFGSARFVDRAAAQAQLQIARQNGQAQDGRRIQHANQVARPETAPPFLYRTTVTARRFCAQEPSSEPSAAGWSLPKEMVEMREEFTPPATNTSRAALARR